MTFIIMNPYFNYKNKPKKKFESYIFSFISLKRSLPDTRYAAKHKSGRWHQPSRLNKNKIPSKVSVKNEFQNFC